MLYTLGIGKSYFPEDKRGTRSLVEFQRSPLENAKFFLPTQENVDQDDRLKISSASRFLTKSIRDKVSPNFDCIKLLSFLSKDRYACCPELNPHSDLINKENRLENSAGNCVSQAIQLLNILPDQAYPVYTKLPLDMLNDNVHEAKHVIVILPIENKKGEKFVQVFEPGMNNRLPVLIRSGGAPVSLISDPQIAITLSTDATRLNRRIYTDKTHREEILGEGLSIDISMRATQLQRLTRYASQNKEMRPMAANTETGDILNLVSCKFKLKEMSVQSRFSNKQRIALNDFQRLENIISKHESMTQDQCVHRILEKISQSLYSREKSCYNIGSNNFSVTIDPNNKMVTIAVKNVEPQVFPFQLFTSLSFFYNHQSKSLNIQDYYKRPASELRKQIFLAFTNWDYLQQPSQKQAKR